MRISDINGAHTRTANSNPEHCNRQSLALTCRNDPAHSLFDFSWFQPCSFQSFCPKSGDAGVGLWQHPRRHCRRVRHHGRGIPARPNNMVSSHTILMRFIPSFALSEYVHTKKTKTANKRSIMNMVEMRLANIPSMVAIGFAYNRIFPVSTDSSATSRFGAMKPSIARNK